MPDFVTADKVLNSVAVELGLRAADVTDPFAETDQNFVQLVKLLTRVGRRLVRARDWTQLTREYTFNTANGTASYALPTGFNRLKDETEWNRGTSFPMGPGATAQQWQELKARTATGAVIRPVRILGNLLLIHPTPTATEAIYYEYITNYWVMPTGQTAPTTTTPTAITDTLWFDEDLLVAALRLEFRQRKGFATPADKDAFDEAWAAAAGSDGIASPIALGTSGNVRLVDTRNLPDTGWGT